MQKMFGRTFLVKFPPQKNDGRKGISPNLLKERWRAGLANPFEFWFSPCLFLAVPPVTGSRETPLLPNWYRTLHIRAR
jgi:hypothetical protein